MVVVGGVVSACLDSAYSLVPMHDIHELLTMNQAAELLGIYPHRMKQLLRDHLLFAVQSEEGRWMIPAVTIVDSPEGWIPMFNLPGTLTLLADAGYNQEETARWMYTYNEELEETPIEALVQGRHHRVNNIARTLGF